LCAEPNALHVTHQQGQGGEGNSQH